MRGIKLPQCVPLNPPIIVLLRHARLANIAMDFGSLIVALPVPVPACWWTALLPTFPPLSKEHHLFSSTALPHSHVSNCAPTHQEFILYTMFGWHGVDRILRLIQDFESIQKVIAK